MIRVLVADDEDKVCQLICGLIDWAALDMEISGVAHNGIEAVELVGQLAPDLIITDIRMPGYDGLELIRRAKELCPTLDFIIISGYRHFEYAQSAIKYGVSDYLLKPINKQELLQTLEKTRQKYRRRTAQLSSEERRKISLQSDIDKLRAGLLVSLLQNGEPRGTQTVERVNADYHFQFKAGCFQAFVLKVDYARETLRQEGMQVLSDKAEQVLQGQLHPKCYDLELCATGCRVYGVLNFDPENRKAVRRQLKNALEELLQMRDIFGEVALTIGLGAPETEISRIGVSLRSAQYAAAQRLIDGTDRLIESAEAISFNGDELLAALSKNLEAAVEVLDEEVAAGALAEFAEQAVAAPAVSGQELFRLAGEACNVYLLLLRNHRLYAGDLQPFYEEFLARADLCAGANDLFQCLGETVKRSLAGILQDKRQEEKKPIRAAKQYIQKNFQNPISLEEVSGVVGFNAAYFSSLFKKESGQNFLEYLSEVRMNQAKELLKDTNLSVAAICEQVGYNDLKHFTQTFKKGTGLKPNEFRKLYS